MAAAASIGLRYGGGNAFLRGEDRIVGGDRAMERRCWLPHRSRSRWAVSAVLAPPASPAQRSTGNATALSSLCLEPFARRAASPRRDQKKGGGDGRAPVPPEKLDEWMRESVAEIVRNIGEAPFLVHVFSNNDGPSGGLRLEREVADAESWPHIRRRWSTGGALPPDGVILVEELKGDEDDGDEATSSPEDSDPAAAPPSDCSSPSSCKKMWGVVVQGRGNDGAACYILDTCRVRSSFGFCTHFCLARATCFGDTADVQLKNAWLLGNRKPHRRHHHHQQ